MGALKLTYRSENPTLKVVWNSLKDKENSCTGAYGFGFNGMEKDDEIFNASGTSYTAEFWQYDSRIGRRWNLDPKPNPSISQYATFACNPIWYSDPLGDTLRVKQNLQSKTDITSLVKNDNAQYLQFNNHMSVSLDFGNLNAEERASLLSNDEGLSLINDMISSDKNFLYEATDVALYKNSNGQKMFSVLSLSDDGIMNISNYGKDSNNKHTMRPKDGYDGQVIIHPTVEFSEFDGNTHIKKSRASIVFHELDENYLRTHFNMDYHSFGNTIGAHNGAIFRERSWHGKSLMPGELSKYPTIPRPSNSTLSGYQKIINKYMGY